MFMNIIIIITVNNDVDDDYMSYGYQRLGYRGYNRGFNRGYGRRGYRTMAYGGNFGDSDWD